jgi:GTP pyrophosphokinase
MERFFAPEETLPAPAVEAKRPISVSGIQVLGTGDLLTQLAHCCNPVPGDDIVGYVTRSRGVTVHRTDCVNVLNEEEHERLVDVEWGPAGDFYPVAIDIEAYDRVGLLRDVSTIIAEEKVNMVAVRTQEREDGTTAIAVTLETQGLDQLSRLLSKLEAVRGVVTVSRAQTRRRARAKKS